MPRGRKRKEVVEETLSTEEENPGPSSKEAKQDEPKETKEDQAQSSTENKGKARLTKENVAESDGNGETSSAFEIQDQKEERDDEGSKSVSTSRPPITAKKKAVQFKGKAAATQKELPKQESEMGTNQNDESSSSAEIPLTAMDEEGPGDRDEKGDTKSLGHTQSPTEKRALQSTAESGERVLVCGDGQIGHQLGHGAGGRLKDKKPRKIDFFEGKSIRQIAAGGMHSVVLLQNGEVYTCGSNDQNQQALGRPEVVAGSDQESDFGKVTFPDEGEVGKIIQIAAGVAYTAALSDTGVVWLWGTFLNSDNKGTIFKEKGKGDEKGKVLAISPKPSILLRKLDPPNRRRSIGPPKVTKIAGGNNHLCLLCSDGEILTCGIGEAGCLGRAPMQRGGRHVQAYRVSSREKFENVWAFGYSCVAMVKGNKKDSRSRVFVWGLNNHGQLGTKSEAAEIRFPVLSEGFDAIGVKEDGWKGFDGEQHVIGLTNSGKVYGCGLAQNSLLGDRDEAELRVPVQIDLGSSSPALGLAASEGGSFVYCEDGKAYSWGANNGGELGLGIDDGDTGEEPEQVKTKHLDDPDADEHFKVIGISANSQHTMFLAQKIES